MLRILLISLLLITSFRTIIFSQNTKEELTNELNQIAKASSIRGFGVAIFTNDRLLYSDGFGYSSSDKKQKYTPDTRQKIASLSKLLLGVSVMKAQEMGLFQLDEDINKYLPFALNNPYHPNRVITIQHLATHSAGLAKLPKFDLKAIYAPTKIPKIKRDLPFGIRKLVFNNTIKKINNNADFLLEDYLFNLYATDGAWYSKKHFLKTELGIEMHYSNTGASLIALIIEKASGIKYADFVQQHILDPLEMNQTSFDFQSNYSAPNISDTYHAGVEVPNDFRLLLYPAGGLESSISNFYLFMKSIANGVQNSCPILSKESIAELLKPQFGSASNYGILWENTTNGYIGHTGDILGATAYAYYNLDQGIGYLLFSNTAGTKTIDQEITTIQSKLKNYFKHLIQNND